MTRATGTTPSYVAFTDTERLIGDAAKNQVAMNPSNTVFGEQINTGLGAVCAAAGLVDSCTVILILASSAVGEPHVLLGTSVVTRLNLEVSDKKM